MKITKKHLKQILKKYMLENNLGYMSMEVSMSMNKQNVLMSLTEDEDDSFNLN